MASFLALKVTPSATRDRIFSASSSYSISLHSNSACDIPFPVSLPFQCRGRKIGGLSIKAMAVSKFKGTQMREKHLTEMIEKKVQEAQQVCEGDQTSDECKVAWDEVEEVSQAKADLRRKLEKQDPLESFCQDNPETDECRIYED
ncbi:PREDICTED: calvin cycle protein CP12-3, chloroplastic [Nelumbo nucifera]|uniref:Calvin cycle protein CP12-3, chloroplastic n=1 Tax=Nelumbo nucifera TaxID=4432 RepID=A0A1U8Q6F3_NELNU|nr:PREDICTED: calvin cycle protein CP12-3, chloroplastic [Nelumbo nucifera]